MALIGKALPLSCSIRCSGIESMNRIFIMFVHLSHQQFQTGSGDVVGYVPFVLLDFESF
jgi:hypothetical protein